MGCGDGVGSGVGNLVGEGVLVAVGGISGVAVALGAAGWHAEANSTTNRKNFLAKTEVVFMQTSTSGPLYIEPLNPIDATSSHHGHAAPLILYNS
jgi:hypothetical protein